MCVKNLDRKTSQNHRSSSGGIEGLAWHSLVYVILLISSSLLSRLRLSLCSKSSKQSKISSKEKIVSVWYSTQLRSNKIPSDINYIFEWCTLCFFYSVIEYKHEPLLVWEMRYYNWQWSCVRIFKVFLEKLNLPF